MNIKFIYIFYIYLIFYMDYGNAIRWLYLLSASYHSGLIENNPNQSWTKQSPVEWLEQRNIPIPILAIKDKIWDILKQHIPPKKYRALQRANIEWNVTSPLNKNLNADTRSQNRSPCALMRKYYGFSKMQARLCRSTMEVLPHIQKAATLASTTCKSVFQYRRWNCSSIASAPGLTPDLTRATREQAYVYAISSAVLTYTLARVCASGSFYHCSCGNHPKDPPNGNFKWGGCGDNIKWGIRFTRRFIDSTEKRSPKDSTSYLQKYDKIHNNKLEISTKQVSTINLHNNRVGRRITAESLTTQCKCHGVSGSCSIKTCWKSLPYVAEIGQKLLRRYTTALEVSKNFLDTNIKYLPEVPGVKSPSLDQLVYLTKSPDYCTKDKRLGSMGTNARKCNATSNGIDGCSQLCCGRGYRTTVEEKLERCQCKYYYCCYVRCKTCRTFVETHRCN